MTYPIPNFERIWVIGYLVDLAKAAREELNYGEVGSIQFIPSTKVVLDDGTSQIITMRPYTVNPDPQNGFFKIQLPATNDPDINPTGWTYEVIEPNGRRYHITVPYDTPVWFQEGDPLGLNGQQVIELVNIVPNPGANPGTVQLIVGKTGRGIIDVDIDVNSHLVGTYDDGMPFDAGLLPVASVAGRTGHIVLAKADVGLNNVNNTADLNKPISNATQTALDTKEDDGTAAAAVAAHAALPDPHPGYLTPAEGTAAYAALSHNHAASAINSGQFSTNRMPHVSSTVRAATGATGVIAIDAAVVGNNLDYTATGDITLGVPTGGSNRQVLRIQVLASVAARNVTFDPNYRISTGIASRTFSVPAGEALLAAVEYSTLLADWVITAATVTAA